MLSIAPKQPKPRMCKVCHDHFIPARQMQKICGYECSVKWAAKARAKAEAQQAVKERRENRAKKEAIKSRADLLREAQTAVNRYVRARDMRFGCVSCPRPASWDGQWHASHLRSVGAASAVRFHLWNIHKACSICNNHLSGNIAGYRPRLIERIGADRVEWIDRQTQLVRYEPDYLRRLKRVFTKKALRQEKRNS